MPSCLKAVAASLAALVAMAGATADARPIFSSKRVSGYGHAQPTAPPLRVRWDHVRYKLEQGSLTAAEQARLEEVLRKWCQCPVERVADGENLSIRIVPFGRGGVNATGAVAKMLLNPRHPGGLQAALESEAQRLVSPYARTR